jgi:hypothetical protein
MQAVGITQAGGIATQAGLLLGVGVTLALLVRSGKRFADTSESCPMGLHVVHCAFFSRTAALNNIAPQSIQALPPPMQRTTPTTGLDPRYGPSHRLSSPSLLSASLLKASLAAYRSGAMLAWNFGVEQIWVFCARMLLEHP